MTGYKCAGTAYAVDAMAQAPVIAEELLRKFEQSARAAAAAVERVPRTPEAIADAVRRIAPPEARIAVADPVNLPEELFAACRRLPGVVAERTRTALSTTDVGVTEAFAAVASTGSLCVYPDRGSIGYLSLLVRIHVAIVDSACVVARPGDLFSRDCLGGRGLQSNFVYVTGPSATADMGPLVRGVHGPHYLHVLLLI